MADGVAITAGAGTTILTDDTGAGGHAQVVKLAIATNGSGTLIPADATDGILVNLGTNNDVTNAGTFAVQAASAGNVAHDAADSGNPVKVGAKAVAHGSNPTAVAVNDRTDLYANRAGVLFTIGGHPNTTSVEYNFTGAQTDDAIVTVAAGLKIVVTRLSVALDEATTVGTAVRVGFGTATLAAVAADGATAAGILWSHPGMVPGSVITLGDGSGILAVGADDEDLRITNEAPTSGAGRVCVSYFTIES